ncbi:hypothetical protein ABIB38_002955 [Massilia sp. UYP11]|uniref:hypothetical protein n=1 Tax=Massilia sp. UYP11 TaxID=1756385 RepID=UPI003D1F405C
MFTMILLLYLQQNLDVTLESSSLRGEFASSAACEEAAVRLRGALPTPEGHAAAWHDALCVPIARGVRVRASAPPDLGALLREGPPLQSAADGAWRRVAELCGQSRTATSGAQSRLNSAPDGQGTRPASPPPPVLSNRTAPPPSAPNMLGRTAPPVRQ